MSTMEARDVTDALPSIRTRASTFPSVAPESDYNSDRYRMNYKNMGMAVIINNKNFHPRTGMNTRTGTDVDAANMKDLLKTIGFENVVTLNDLTAFQMIDHMRKVALLDHSENSCFVCVILTHGEEGYVFGTDDKVQVEQMVAPFKGHKCLSLAGKPKIFLIQACRGTELDPGVEVPDGMEIEMEEEVRRIPTEADFLMAYSVVPGYFAWRNSTRGSWFIQAVYDVIKTNWKTMDLLTMMTRVNKKVAYDFQSNANKEHMNNKKQIPCITSMLTKDVFFYQ
ncbi:caspase-3 [Biomphalaria glabrata]|uniref:Caspase-3-like n=1 Tax=Biomphalaria glabrata TaxID=6526 RepID=A0A182YTP8_BIOGL|nr:caspase-3-like [Biomphalaria glabrata]KAI8765541.1 caspase-3-like [Biomphalaria glabrata]KAI8797529.1 caspase-3 [Biomphalaria glabrata]